MSEATSTKSSEVNVVTTDSFITVIHSFTYKLTLRLITQIFRKEEPGPVVLTLPIVGD
jgi:hypothetical protein